MRRLTTGLALGAAAATFAAGAPAASALPGATPAGATSDRQELKLGAEDRLVRRSVTTDPDGTRHIRYDRTWKGLRVVGGDLVVEKEKGGRIEDVHFNNGRSVAAPTSTPSVTKAAAVSKGQQRSTATGEKSVGELVVWAASGSPRLAYDVLTTGTLADQTPSRLHTVVDAESGAVITSYDEVVTAPATASTPARSPSTRR